MPTASVPAPSRGSIDLVDLRRRERLGRPRPRARIEQRERARVRVVDGELAGRVAQHVGARGHDRAGLLPGVGLLVADPHRLEDRVRRVEVRADRAVEVLEARAARRAAAAWASARRSIQIIAGRTGRPSVVAHHHAVELRPERQPPDRVRRRRGSRPTSRAHARSTAAVHMSGSCSAHAGRGKPTSYASYAESISSPSSR